MLKIHSRYGPAACSSLQQSDFSCSFGGLITRPAVQDATETNRQLLRWIFHPQVLCTFVAHQVNRGIKAREASARMALALSPIS